MSQGSSNDTVQVTEQTGHSNRLRDSRIPVSADAKDRVADEKSSVGRNVPNRPHRITRDGIEFDTASPTAAPDMTKPMLETQKPVEPTRRTSPRSAALPGTRSHETDSLIGRTIRLELKKKHVVKSVAFISNKGGVGKTHAAANMAFNLARLGKKPLLIDADLSNSDISNKLGFYCENTIVDLLKGRQFVNQLVYTSPLGFDIIAGESGNVKLANLASVQKKRFIKAFKEIGNEYDFVLYDLSAGIGSTTLDFALAQDYQIVITTPQDIVAGYACVKAAFHRFQELETTMATRDPDYKMRTTFRPFVVLNQVNDFDTGRRLYEKMVRVAKHNLSFDRQFHLAMNFLGVITNDPSRIREAELERFLYSKRYGASHAGQCFNFLAENLLHYRDPNSMEFTTKLKRFVDIFMKSVDETRYAR